MYDMKWKKWAKGQSYCIYKNKLSKKCVIHTEQACVLTDDIHCIVNTRWIQGELKKIIWIQV